ncbi:MAG: aminoacyl-tRNA hydrolase [Ilumatobacter sp.]|jgi:PTH1 family peptidyl-tRNA hydrolase|uniref:aminoacyl-tRNA hydrolase n=1 Tax=uncultured Ilumatobacter sp. TaxID=879968 RepID=UPI003591B15A|tara:strand:+ start:1899 stop:2516 length:618 start_codon:yes stop_codon:yes gene_type:complete
MSLFGRTGKGAPFDWLVVGLGNPGPKYIGTRHNVGEDVVKLLAERHREQLKGGRDNALTAETRFGAPGNDERVVLSFPITYMNESGQAVGAQVRRYRIASVDRIIVIHDELDLDPGVLRVKQGGGLAGHNGLRSITAHTKSQDYLRVRIGVGKPPSGAGKNYVLSKVPKSERERLDVAVVDAADAVELIISDGVEAAMRRYNIKQ